MWPFQRSREITWLLKKKRRSKLLQVWRRSSTTISSFGKPQEIVSVKFLKFHSWIVKKMNSVEIVSKREFIWSVFPFIIVFTIYLLFKKTFTFRILESQFSNIWTVKKKMLINFHYNPFIIFLAFLLHRFDFQKIHIYAFKSSGPVLFCCRNIKNERTTWLWPENDLPQLTMTCAFVFFLEVWFMLI